MKKIIQKFGVTEKEASIFIRLLELGAQPAGVMAKQMHMPRSSIYLCLENLKKQQLIISFQRGKITYFKCIPVKELPEILKHEERKIKQTESVLEEKLPALLKLENRLSITPSVRHFEGKEAVLKMYERIIKEEDFYAILNTESVEIHMKEYYEPIPKMIKKEKRKVKELLVQNKTGLEYQKKYDSRLHQIRILPKGTVFYSDNIICEEKIYMVAYGEKNVSAVEITNPILAHSHRSLFEVLWGKP
jgi:sugar-specific transcriptional regulator TrmB